MDWKDCARCENSLVGVPATPNFFLALRYL